jgi:hypothetical protein
MDNTEEVPPADFDAGRMPREMDALIQTAGITKLKNTNRIYRLYKWAEKSRSIYQEGPVMTPEKKFEIIMDKCKMIKNNGIDENGIMEILEIVFSRKSHAESSEEIISIIDNTVNNDIKCHLTETMWDRFYPIIDKKCGESKSLAIEMVSLVDRNEHHIDMHDLDADTDARQRALDENYSFEHNRGGRKTNRRKNKRKNKRKTRKNKRRTSWKYFKQRPRKISNWTF